MIVSSFDVCWSNLRDDVLMSCCENFMIVFSSVTVFV